MNRAELPRGLYVITDAQLTPPERLLPAVSSALAGGARTVQYRDKSAEHRRRAREAAMLAALCREHGAVFIVNDDVALAAAVGAHGVHLGAEDAGVAAARERLGDDALIGVSCYDSLARADAACAAGADYVALGSFFPSATKPAALRVAVQVLAQARTRVGLPIVAIGGITPANGAALVAAGAHALAVVSGVFAQQDVRAAAQRYAALYLQRS